MSDLITRQYNLQPVFLGSTPLNVHAPAFIPRNDSISVSVALTQNPAYLSHYEELQLNNGCVIETRQIDSTALAVNHESFQAINSVAQDAGKEQNSKSQLNPNIPAFIPRNPQLNFSFDQSRVTTQPPTSLSDTKESKFTAECATSMTYTGH